MERWEQVEQMIKVVSDVFGGEGHDVFDDIVEEFKEHGDVSDAQYADLQEFFERYC